jgi:hypothetical protein
MKKAEADAIAATDQEESPQDGKDGNAPGGPVGMGEMDEDAVDRELATLGKVPIDDRIVFGDGSPDEVAAEVVGKREIGDDEVEPAVVVEDVPADPVTAAVLAKDAEGGFLMGEVIPQLHKGKWGTDRQLSGLLLRNREYVDELLRV